MSYSLNEKIKDLKPYDPIQGEYQIRLDANESFLSVPDEILEQFHTYVNQIAFTVIPTHMPTKPLRHLADITM